MSRRSAMVALAFILTTLVIPVAHAAAETFFEPSQATFVMAEGDTPPPLEPSNGQTRSLPDDWNATQPGVGGDGWYRFTLALDEAPRTPWAIHLRRLRMNAAVFVNGGFIGDGGRFTEPMSRNWNRPLYFVVPSGLLRQGDNSIDVRVRDSANVHGGLYGIEIGPHHVLEPRYRWRFFLKVDLIQASMVLAVAMGLVLATFSLRWRQDTTYGWFAGTMLLWSANSTHFFVRDLPISTQAWEWFAQVGTDAFAVLLAISLHRFLDLRRPRTETTMGVYLAVDGLVLSAVGLDRMLAVANILHVGAVAVGTYMIGTLIWHGRRSVPEASSVVIVGSGIVIQSAFGFHDWLLQCGMWPQDHWYLMHYASPALFVMLTWILASRFVQAHRESEALNRDLERRVADKHRELDESYGKLRALEREQAVVRERDRIMRDLHDGLGGHLVSALALVEHGEDAGAVEETLRDALGDLRLVIESLDPDIDDLPVLLGVVRMRIEDRMARQGIRFDWQVKDVPPMSGFAPATSLQVLRIVQEAFANVLKHAGATTIRVRVAPTNGSAPAGVCLEITDDGKGMREGTKGRGLENMRRRAVTIGGELDVTSQIGRGTRVRLWLPLQLPS